MKTIKKKFARMVQNLKKKHFYRKRNLICGGLNFKSLKVISDFFYGKKVA